ncbi:hypothetical protein EPO66_03660, partial [bacterium]
MFSKISNLKIPLAIFILSIILSTCFSVNPVSSLKEIYKYLSGILLFIFAASLTKDEKHRAVKIIVFSATLIGILAIHQYFFGFKHLLSYLSKENITDPFILEYASQKRVFFPFVTPNILGDYLLLITPIALIIKGKKKWLILIILVFALFLTKSINAAIGFLAGMVFYFHLRKDLPFKKYYLVALPVVISIIIIILRQITIKEHLLPLFSAMRR